MDDGCLWDDSDLSQPYRDETRLHVLECLGLTDDLNGCPVRSVNPTILAFEGIGNAIRSVYTYEQRCRFMKHMENFLEMSRREQALRLRGTLPTVEEFWSYRLGSSAVHITLAMNEFACNTNSLPASVMGQEHMTLLWEYTNIIISITNDILSLKKEVTRGSIGSMIPLEYAQSRNAQSAVDKTTLLLANAIDAFKQTAEKLLQRSPEITSCEQTRALGDFVKGCQFYCTGNLAWSLATRRYGIYEHDLAKGVCITL
ncbi:MAG: hypothetical protein LQ349_003306 [Xanthoria aureola]|nr:MAG: hypothetical protein LQ349_003306 [Xanthoria aureola]